MQRWLTVVLGLLAAAPAVSAQNAGGENAAKYGWRSSWESARAEAKRTGKPLFVVFRCQP
jgi:hypothetical protein